MKKGSEVSFGIEIECYVPVGTRGFEVGAYHNGVQISGTPQGWNGQSDGSLGDGTTVNGIRYRPISGCSTMPNMGLSVEQSGSVLIASRTVR